MCFGLHAGSLTWGVVVSLQDSDFSHIPHYENLIRQKTAPESFVLGGEVCFGSGCVCAVVMRGDCWWVGVIYRIPIRWTERY